MKRWFRRGISVLFEQDPATAAGANNPGANGGAGDDKGQVGAAGGKAKEDAYELIVNGEKRSVTIDEMRNLAMKAAGADARFEEAAKLRQGAEDAIRLNDLVTRLSDPKHEPTETEIREFAGKIGVDPQELMEHMMAKDNTDGTKGTDDTKGKGGNGLSEEAFDAMFATKLGVSPAEAKQRLEYAHQRDIEVAKQQIRNLSDEAVDKDEIFGKMIVGENGKDRLATIKEMVAEDVIRRIQDGTPFGADLVAASVQKTRAYLTKFGIPNKPDSGLVALGLAPSEGLPLEVQSEKPIPYVSAAEDKDETNFINRAMQRGLKLMRQQTKR